MDSPTLINFNYEQFWFEDRQWREQLQSEFTSSSSSPTTTPIIETPQSSEAFSESSQGKKKAKKPRQKANTQEDYKATKNIVKNYGKAITNFILSPVALPYLFPLLDSNTFKLDGFLLYAKLAKESIQGIDTFRCFLLIREDDNLETQAYKEAFRSLAIIFVKYFSVNWIAHSRLKNKLVYLKYRFRILRRILDPNSFTYLKGPKCSN